MTAQPRAYSRPGIAVLAAPRPEVKNVSTARIGLPWLTASDDIADDAMVSADLARILQVELESRPRLVIRELATGQNQVVANDVGDFDASGFGRLGI